MENPPSSPQRCDIVTVQPISIIDHIIKVPDMLSMTELIHSSDDVGGSRPVTAEELKDILSKSASYESRPGGSASNVLRTLASFVRDGDVRVKGRIVGAIGADKWGSLFKQSMREKGIDTTFLYEKEGNTGCCCVVTCDEMRTMRTMFENAAKLTPANLTMEHIQGARYVFVSSYCFYQNGLVEKIVELGQESGCHIVCDLASWDIVEKFGDRLLTILEKNPIDICFCNEDEAKKMAMLGQACANPTIEQGAQRLLDHGSKKVIVTQGKDGSSLFYKKGDSVVRYHQDAYKIESIEDVTGAGDAFSAGVLWGLLQGFELTTALRLGSLAGSTVIQCTGADISPDSWAWFYDKLQFDFDAPRNNKNEHLIRE